MAQAAALRRFRVLLMLRATAVHCSPAGADPEDGSQGAADGGPRDKTMCSVGTRSCVQLAAALLDGSRSYAGLKAAAGGGAYMEAWRMMRSASGGAFGRWIAKPPHLEHFGGA